MFVARHSSSKTLVVVKQTNVDVQNAGQLDELKVCVSTGNFAKYIYVICPLGGLYTEKL